VRTRRARSGPGLARREAFQESIPGETLKWPDLERATSIFVAAEGRRSVRTTSSDVFDRDRVIAIVA
jgi:hypothetical protein